MADNIFNSDAAKDPEIQKAFAVSAAAITGAISEVDYSAGDTAKALHELKMSWDAQLAGVIIEQPRSAGVMYALQLNSGQVITLGGGKLFPVPMMKYFKDVQNSQLRQKRAQRRRYLQRRKYFNNVKLSAWLYWRHNNEAPICITDIARRRPLLRVYDRISKQRGRTMWQLKTVLTV